MKLGEVLSKNKAKTASYQEFDTNGILLRSVNCIDKIKTKVKGKEVMKDCDINKDIEIPEGAIVWINNGKGQKKLGKMNKGVIGE